MCEVQYKMRIMPTCAGNNETASSSLLFIPRVDVHQHLYQLNSTNPRHM